VTQQAAATDTARYPFGDELASSILHGIGIVLSIVGLVLLVTLAAVHGHARAVVSCAVFGSTLVLLYTASTLYHAIPLQRLRPILRRIDHIAIFILIAGTYTPFTLLALPGAWGWSLFTAIWVLALAGSVLELGLVHLPRRVAALLYVAMGWVGVVAIEPLYHHLQAGGLVLLLAGGVAYTLGVPFYLYKRMPYHHTVWHAFVLAGSVLHYLAVLLYVLPGSVSG